MFDVIVLTAANAAQAEGYRVQMAWRQQNGLIDPQTRVFVFTDPGGRRVGSFGATIHVLNELTTLLPAAFSRKNSFEGQNILICHSGGDSRRTPAYTAQGKIFTPVPTRGADQQPLALFDLIHRTVTNVPQPEGGQVLITSGDVLLTFDHASVDFSKPGVTGVAYFGPVERGARHGVYIPDQFDAHEDRTVCLPVADFLQKPSAELVAAHRGIDPFGRVAIDTGLVRLDPATCQHLLNHAVPRAKKNGLLQAVVEGLCPSMDLYEEFMMALVPSITEEAYIQQLGVQRKHAPAHLQRLRAFYRAMHTLSFHVNIVPTCEFFHIGSSRELLTGFSTLSRTAQTYAFENGSASVIEDANNAEQSFIFNSCIQASLQTGRALIEAVDYAGPRMELMGDNIVTGLPAEAREAVVLPAGIGLVCLPIQENQWSVVVYGLEDDFKTPFGTERTCHFLNHDIAHWMKSNHITASQMWQQGEQKDGLWRARIWRVGPLNEVLSEALQIATGGGWTSTKRAARYSLADLVVRVNQARLLEVRREIHRKINVMQVRYRLLNDDALSARTVCDEIRTEAEAFDVLQQLSNLVQSETQQKPLLRARVLKLMAMIRERHLQKRDVAPTSEAFLREAFAAVSESVAVNFVPMQKPRAAAILHDQVVWVTTPVRIDFAGGWSDTPPICSELGGQVLNAAITLNGLYPIQVMAKLNNAGTIRLSSIDLGQRQEIATTEDVLDHHDPYDWAALAKAALVLTGIVPSHPEKSLKAWLRKLGGGLDLTIFSALPKGSGLGTSSILGAAVMACLDRVLGIPYQADRIIRMTSILEQRMNTGGGWQDQVGGILPGVKLISTQPGSDQTIALRWAVFDMTPGSILQQRCLLYFTGQKRMARNILHNVVGNYLARAPQTYQIVKRLKQGAVRTKEALDAQDVQGFAAGVAEYWELKKAIDAGSTNPSIEAVLELIRDDVDATLLPGAGGGGFIFMIAKDAAAAQRIRETLTAHPLNAQSRFFDFAVDQQGLKVTVL